ncbi:MAG: ABC transporter ATP-binding protein [Thermoplasmatales archaeon]|nr:ABC transporter ATP-binding protein [Thermoplasmatales archaeon]
MIKIRLEGLKKSFGSDMAADGIDLTVESGEYLCILGPTGSGKTTLMRMVCGLTEPDEGRVFFGDEDVTHLDTAKRGATMLSQTYALFPNMSVRDNVLFGSWIKGWPEDDSKRLARNILTMMHMETRSKAYPNELSGGQQQRIALARALASGSKILLLDEPLRALDARLRLELRKDLKNMVKAMGLTAIHVTHDQEEALEMADRIAVLREGKIIQVGTPKEVFEDPKTPFVANFLGRSNLIQCRVVGSENGKVLLENDKGVRMEARDGGQAPGTNVLMAVKVGNTKLTIKPPGYFEGRVEKILYEGATITLEVMVRGLGLVYSKLPNRKFDDFREGNRVFVNWSPDKAKVFDIPEGGIEHEVRVD